MQTSHEQNSTLSFLLAKAIGSADAASLRKAIASVGDASLDARRIANRLLLREPRANLDKRSVLSKALQDTCDACPGVTAMAERVLRNARSKTGGIAIGRALEKAVSCDDLLRKIESWRETALSTASKSSKSSGSTKRKKEHDGESEEINVKRPKTVISDQNQTEKLQDVPHGKTSSFQKHAKVSRVVPNYSFANKKEARDSIFEKALKQKADFAQREAELAVEAVKGVDLREIGVAKCVRCEARYDRGDSEMDCLWHPGVFVEHPDQKVKEKYWTCCFREEEDQSGNGCRASDHTEVVIAAEARIRQAALKKYKDSLKSRAPAVPFLTRTLPGAASAAKLILESKAKQPSGYVFCFFCMGNIEVDRDTYATDLGPDKPLCEGCRIEYNDGHEEDDSKQNEALVSCIRCGNGFPAGFLTFESRRHGRGVPTCWNCEDAKPFVQNSLSDSVTSQISSPAEPRVRIVIDD